MSFHIVVAYAIVNIVFLLWVIRNKGLRLTPGLVLVAFYCLIACLSIPAYKMLPNAIFFDMYDFKHITLFPYIILFVATYMFIRPLFSFDGVLKRAKLNINLRNVKNICWFYIFCATISALLYYRVSDSISIEDMAAIRADVYDGVMIDAYNNIFERFFLSFTSYFNTPMIIVFFVLLARYRDQCKKIFFLLLGFSLVVPAIGDSIRTVSRGVLVSLFMQLIIGFSFFSSYFNKGVIRKVFIAFILLTSVIYGISSILTEARFGEGESGFESVIVYWGQPPLIFNSQVFYINEYAFGRHFFYPIADFFGAAPKAFLAKQGKLFDPCFTTFVGDFYRDGGILLVFILAIIIPRIIIRIIKKKEIGIPELYIMMFYSLFLQHGALVTRFGFCYNVFVCIMIFFILKFITTNRQTI